MFETRLLDGEDVYTGLHVTSVDGTTPVTSSVVRRLAEDFAELQARDAAARRALFLSERGRTDRPPALLDAVEDALKRQRGTKMGAPRIYPSKDVARVAQRAIDLGRSPVQEVRAKFKVDASYASRLVKRVRKEGLLREGKGD